MDRRHDAQRHQRMGRPGPPDRPVRQLDPLAGDEPGRGYHSNGLIDEALLDALSVDGAHYYLCGPEPMLRHVHALLSRRGVPMDRVHYEFFGPAALAA